MNGGTIKWMSPELLDPDQFGFENSRPTKESDCYALGMVILEVLTGQAPFTPYKDFVVMRKVIEGHHPARPEGTWFTDDLWERWSCAGQPNVNVALASRRCLSVWDELRGHFPTWVMTRRKILVMSRVPKQATLVRFSVPPKSQAHLQFISYSKPEDCPR